MNFSITFPLISAILVLILGIIIFLKNYKSKINLLFLILCLLAVIWLFGTFMMFLNIGNDQLAIFWDRFIYLGVVFTPVVFYQFSVIYCRLEGKQNLIKIGYILSIIFLILSRTDYFVSGLFKYQWGVHTKAQLFHHLFLIYFIIFMSLVIINFYNSYKRNEGVLRRQALYMLIAFSIFIPLSSVAYLPAYSISIYPFAYTSGVVFTFIIGHLIMRRN